LCKDERSSNLSFSKFRTKEEQLSFSDKHSHVWIAHSPVCTKIIDLDFNLQFMSPAGICALAISDVTQFYGKPYPFDFYPQSFIDEMSKNLKQVRDTGEVIEQESSVVDINGNELWFHSTISPVSEGDGKIDYLMVVSINTTAQHKVRKELEQLNEQLEAKVHERTLELERVNARLHYQSETDFLTKLSNRYAFNRHISEKIATAKRNKGYLSLLIIDVDNFKDYNDRYGHDVGDCVLQKVAKTIDNAILRETDIVARYGGDEFVILLPQTDKNTAFILAERVRTNIELLKVEYDTTNLICNITVSIGVASLRGSELTPADLLKKADKALYVAKQKGRDNSQVFSD